MLFLLSTKHILAGFDECTLRQHKGFSHLKFLYRLQYHDLTYVTVTGYRSNLSIFARIPINENEMSVEVLQNQKFSLRTMRRLLHIFNDRKCIERVNPPNRFAKSSYKDAEKPVVLSERLYIKIYNGDCVDVQNFEICNLNAEIYSKHLPAQMNNSLASVSKLVIIERGKVSNQMAAEAMYMH